MPKDNRNIVRSVRLGPGHVFNAGQEDELEKAMTAEQYDRLTSSGSLEGDWKPGGEGVGDDNVGKGPAPAPKRIPAKITRSKK